MVTKLIRGTRGNSQNSGRREEFKTIGGAQVEKVSTYRECLDLLAGLGVWAPEGPGPRNPSLRWGNNRQGEPIRGIYLNEIVSGRAYFTLLPGCKLRPAETLWQVPPAECTPEENPALRHIFPRPDREREALRQLFGRRDLQ